MYYGLAYVFCLVIHIIHYTKINYFRDSWHTSFCFTAFNTDWPVYIFIRINSNQKLVLDSCCICYFTGLRAFHENAFVHNSKQRLSITEETSIKIRHIASKLISKKCNINKFYIIYVDSMAGIWCIPSKINSFLAIHTKKIYNIYNLHNNGIYHTYWIHSINNINGNKNRLYIINTTCDAAINNLNFVIILSHILKYNKHFCIDYQARSSLILLRLVEFNYLLII